MFKDTLPHRVSIYRLSDFADYDHTGSGEGEVTDTWLPIEIRVRARFEPEDTPFSRRADGVVNIGDHTFFVGPEVDIQNADRAYRADGEFGSDFFEVLMVKPIRDFNNRIHHKEIKCTHIDWTPPLSVIEAS